MSTSGRKVGGTSVCCNSEIADNGEGFEVCLNCGTCNPVIFQNPPNVYDWCDNSSPYYYQIRDVCEHLNYSEGVCNLAVYNFSQIRKREKKNEKKIDDRSLMAFCTLASCRQNSLSCPPEIIEKLFLCKSKTVDKTFRHIEKNITSCVWIEALLSTVCKLVPHTAFTDVYCHNLAIPYNHIPKISRIVCQISENELASVNAATSNAVAIYLYCSSRLSNVSLNTIAQVCDRHENTIMRNLYKISSNRRSELLMFC